MTDTFVQTDLTATLRPDPDEYGECRRCHGDAEGCMCGTGPYYEMYAHDSMTMMCNLCGFETHNGPCPLHAPTEIPGLYRIPCDAVPPHSPAFVVQGDANDYEMCPWCAWRDARDRHEGCEHAGHGRWRSWWATRRVVHLLSRLNLVTYSSRHGGGCRGCFTRIRFERVRRQRGWEQ